MKTTILTLKQAKQLVTLPVTDRPRVYGVISGGKYNGQIQAITSEYYLNQNEYSEITTISDVTIFDLISKA